MERLKKNSISTLAACAVVLVLLFSSCAGGAPAAKTGEPEASTTQKAEQPPDWVLQPPEGDDQYEYFVGSASNESGDRVAAEEQAVNSLIAEITRFMGVRITAESTATAKSSLESYQASVTQVVKQSGSAQVAGFKVVDKFVDQREGGQVSVYILGRYNRQDLLKEKRRLAELFEEQIRSVEEPEEQGKALAAEGKYIQAIQKFTEAAAAAAGSTIDNADVKFERNINNAKSVVEKISLEKLNDNISGAVREPFGETFDLRVYALEDGEETPIEGANIRVSYKIIRSNGRTGVKSVNRETNSDGILSFEHPVPEIVGTETVTMALDLSSYIEPLEDVSRSYQSAVEGLTDLINEKRVSFQYTAISRAKEIPTGIVVLDTDIAGNPTGNSNTASGILESLSQANFSIRTLNYDAEKLADLSDPQLIAEIKKQFGGQIDRLIFGVVSLDKFDESDDSYLVRVSGTVKAADLASGRILYSKSSFKNSRGSSSKAVISSAFKSLGIQLGEEMARNLP
jgi:hypothetical protein